MKTWNYKKYLKVTKFLNFTGFKAHLGLLHKHYTLSSFRLLCYMQQMLSQCSAQMCAP